MIIMDKQSENIADQLLDDDRISRRTLKLKDLR